MLMSIEAMNIFYSDKNYPDTVFLYSIPRFHSKLPGIDEPQKINSFFSFLLLILFYR